MGSISTAMLTTISSIIVEQQRYRTYILRSGDSLMLHDAFVRGEIAKDSFSRVFSYFEERYNIRSSTYIEPLC